jgi:hypothetical protein
MSIVEKVKEIVSERDRRGANDPDFQRLEQFYREKKEQGAVINNGYTLPVLDTIGREIYQSAAGRQLFRCTSR